MTAAGWILGGAVALLLLVIWFFWHRTERVPCHLDLERTHDHFHAHVELMEFFPEPGDSVRVEGDGDLVRLDYGEAAQRESQAVVTRASALRRAWTRLTGRLEFKELFEVGFE